jgi:hypothetical protein
MGNAAPPIERLREEPHGEYNIRSVTASTVPRKGKAYRSLSALVCGLI